MKYLAVITTIGSRAEAQRMACSLVERRLVACAQISEIESFYRWDGAVRNEAEFRILFKTTTENYGAVAQAIRELHPYELPAVHAHAIERIDEAYAAWLQSHCDESGCDESHRDGTT